MKLKTPILLLIFNRPETTKQVFEAIRIVKPEKLFIVADGPRITRPGEKEKCEETRLIVSNIDWECEVKTLFRETNLGCGRSVSEGISWFFEQVEEGIILEDDTIPHSTFFLYCETMLNRYRGEEKVMHIAGVNFQNGVPRGTGSYYFSKYPHIWGWATWKRAWQQYDEDLADWPAFRNSDQFKKWCFNQEENLFWTNLLEATSIGEIDTWDYQWVFTIMKNQGLCVMPNQNIVSNVGFGSGATHTLDLNSKLANLPVSAYLLPDNPSNKIMNFDADMYTFTNVFNPVYKPLSLVDRLKRRFWSLFKSILIGSN